MLIPFELYEGEDGEVVHVHPACVESVVERTRGEAKVVTLVMESGDKFLVKDEARTAADKVNEGLLRLDGREEWDTGEGD